MNIKRLLALGVLCSMFFVGCSNNDIKDNTLDLPNEATKQKTMTKVQNDINEIKDKDYNYVLNNLGQPDVTSYWINKDDVNDLNSVFDLEKIKNNIPLIEENVKQIFSENNYDMTFDINYGLNYFPEKEYRGLKYNEGYYESVVISIGKAEGDNWWCVLFPNLCLVDLETKDNVEYKSWIVEKINKIF